MSALPGIEQPVVDLFLALQRSLNAWDADAVAAAFGAELLLGDPDGERAIQNNAAFRAEIDERLGWLRVAGTRDVKALQIDPVPLGPNYVLVHVRWSVWFTPEGRADFVDEFLVDYIVRFFGNASAIVAAFGHDSARELRRRFRLIA